MKRRPATWGVRSGRAAMKGHARATAGASGIQDQLPSVVGTLGKLGGRLACATGTNLYNVPKACTDPLGDLAGWPVTRKPTR